MPTSSKPTVWDRVIDPHWADLEPQAARSILRLKFTKADVARMNKLAEWNRQGRLTEKQREEMEYYLHVGHMLAIFHSKARMALKRSGAPSRARRLPRM
jgi:hypothetical protein